MKKFTPLLIIFITTISFSQHYKQDANFGKLTREEYEIKTYDKDSTANALVLYESGKSYFTVKKNKVVVKTIYHFKIKIFNSDGFQHASFSIPIYNTKSGNESVEDIVGITHNGFHKTHLMKNHIFKEKINDNWKEVKFTMPNLKEGSIVEVNYTLVTPFKFNLTGWKFQSDIPKLVSEYKALIPGNYIYNRKLTGYLKLTTNSSTVKKDCFRVQGFSGHADCENVVYKMENIPAFEEEDYMTSKNNFISKIKFELKETKWFDGSAQKFTTTWDVTDKEFRTDKNIGIQLKKTKYFEELIPSEIKNITNELEKAKTVYSFIQHYFTWNEKYSIFRNVKIKNAIENNISLINALKSVGLDTELVVLSTRNNGFPTRLYPVISDFNYVIAKLNINNKVYLLDATDKLNPFGQLPFKCLNSFGRVMDFENDSYWYDFKPETNSKSVVYANLILSENGKIEGKLKRVSTGHNAYLKRKDYNSKSNDDIVSEFEDEFTNLIVEDYSLENKNDIDKPLIEVFDVVFDYEENTNKIYFNPFFGGRFEENPFKQENRLYPVDFGYHRKYILHFNLEIPDNYKIESLPVSNTIKFDDDTTNYRILTKNHDGYKFTLYSKLNIGKTIFYNKEYGFLKEIFKQAIISQQTPLVLSKINI